MRKQLGRVFLELRARGRRQGQDRVGDQGQLGGEAGPPVLGAGLDVPVHPQDGDVPGSEGRQSRPALPVLGPHGVPHGPAVADTPELVHLAVDGPDHLLDVAPDGGETDGPGAGAGPHYDGAVAGPELLPDGLQRSVSPGAVHSPGLDVQQGDHWPVVRLLQFGPAVEHQARLLLALSFGSLRRFSPLPEDPVCPGGNSRLLAGVEVVREEIVFVSGSEGDRTLRESLEDVASTVFTPQLVGSRELSPVLPGYQVLHLVPTEVDPVVEISAPEDVVVGQHGSPLPYKSLLQSGPTLYL